MTNRTIYQLLAPAVGALLNDVKKLAASGEFVGVGITGRHRCFVAGADLNALQGLNEPTSARPMARLRQDVFATLATMDVPTFAFINGVAIGGGLELALAAGCRTISAMANGISLPETFLGLVRAGAGSTGCPT